MNELFGWTWITLGIASGVLLGLGFLRDDFLGGYDSPRRRLLRLGHIAFFGLGILNILFAQSIDAGSGASTPATVASVAFIVSGVAMPLTCGLVAWRRRLHPLFAIPVLGALLGAVLAVLEVLP